MTQQLGIGVLGLNEGRTLLTALNDRIPTAKGASGTQPTRAPHARVVAACDLKQETIDAAQRQRSDVYFTTAYADMLKRRDVDIVAIYTPDKWHGAHIVQAFEAGKHVMVNSQTLWNILPRLCSMKPIFRPTWKKDWKPSASWRQHVAPL